MLERNKRTEQRSQGGQGQLLRAGEPAIRNSTVTLQRKYLTAQRTPAAAFDEVSFGSSH